jgi:hypothetical protein
MINSYPQSYSSFILADADTGVTFTQDLIQGVQYGTGWANAAGIAIIAGFVAVALIGFLFHR